MFRILSIDGGGIKGTFAAAALAQWEEELDIPIVDHFDLITGTSTGSIIAIGLAMGLTARELCDFYISRGPNIFPSTGTIPKVGRLFKWVTRPKYSQQVLRAELINAYRDKQTQKDPRVRDAKTRLLVPSYDILSGRIFLFKTGHHERFKYDLDILAADIALASSSAPTFFEAAKIPQHSGQGYIDGGVWANCPAMAGVLEAKHFLNIPLDEIRVLSIGATYAPDTMKHLAGSGMMGWSTKIVSLMMSAQVEASHVQAMLLVGRENFLRVNCLTKPGEYSLDSASEVQHLAARGRAEAVKKEVTDRVFPLFLNGQKADPFVPVTH